MVAQALRKPCISTIPASGEQLNAPSQKSITNLPGGAIDDPAVVLAGGNIEYAITIPNPV